MHLSIDDYNVNEKEGKRELPNKFVEAFQPENFNQTGFPSRIEDEMEVYKFIECMHDGRLKKYYESKACMYAPTYEEFEIMKALAKDIYQFSKEKYGKGIVVKASLLASINVLRRIKYLSGGEQKLPTVFEIGGGNGILGTLLHRFGYKYIATDITQAFYLTQNNLWEGLHPDCVVECMEAIENLNAIDNGKIIHIPYWKLWELRNSDLEADIIVSNHNLVEMHKLSLKFYLQYAKQLMRNSKYKLFIAQQQGEVITKNVDYLLHTFRDMGFEIIYSEREFIVWALNTKEHIIPVHFGSLMRQDSYQRAFPVCGNPLDETAARIYLGERKIRDKQKVSLLEMEEYFHTLDDNIDSPDEEFIHYCGLSDL